ncbi:hypothetical protein A2U01_0055565, partial [Trifolium medium]|nr:hypothetical protein [Trifolium medium]
TTGCSVSLSKFGRSLALIVTRGEES